MWSKRTFTLCLVALMAAITLLADTPAREAAQAAPAAESAQDAAPRQPAAPLGTPVTFRVTVERVTATNNFDGPFDWDRADFYARVRIGDQILESPVWSNQDDIRPNWQFSGSLDVDDVVADSASIGVEIWDADDFGNRQLADLTGDADRGLTLTVDVNDCLTLAAGAVTGSVSGRCGETLFSSGTAAENTADIRFRIEADLPASSDDLLVRCLHDPIWPQAGENFEVQGEALDDSLSAKTVDEIEIWLMNTDAPADTCATDDTCVSETTAPSSGSTMFYGCLARDDGTEVWSGWRRVQVGAPPSGSAVPVLFNGPSNSLLDVVLVPDQGSYTNELDAAFLSDVRDIIYDAYYGASRRVSGADSDYGERIYLVAQSQINFWIATDTGVANGFPNSPCVAAPGNWGSNYTFAETGIIVHTDSLRDCARRAERIFSTEPFSTRTVLHETSHSPFGLADEYCCDSSYFEPSPLPNIYGSVENCQSDVLNLQVWDLIIGDPTRTTGDCAQLMDGGGATIPWFTSEPTADDLMRNSGEYNAADVRRIAWGLDQCNAGGCQGGVGSPGEPVPDINYGGLLKTVLVEIDFASRTDLTLLPNSPLVIYGTAPAHFGHAPLLRIDLFDTSDQLIRQFNHWHPLQKAGTLEYNQFQELVHDPTEWLDEATAQFLLPYSQDLAWMRIVDLELNETLITVDLLPAMLDFCEENPDEECERVGAAPVETFLPVTVGPGTVSE